MIYHYIWETTMFFDIMMNHWAIFVHNIKYFDEVWGSFCYAGGSTYLSTVDESKIIAEC